jgi:sensor domain CHASE-containing protein
MFLRLNLSTKILVALLPLFLLAVVLSVYLTHRYQGKQALEQMQNAALAQATIIKESLVHQTCFRLPVYYAPS